MSLAQRPPSVLAYCLSEALPQLSQPSRPRSIVCSLNITSTASSINTLIPYLFVCIFPHSRCRKKKVYTRWVGRNGQNSRVKTTLKNSYVHIWFLFILISYPLSTFLLSGKSYIFLNLQVFLKDLRPTLCIVYTPDIPTLPTIFISAYAYCLLLDNNDLFIASHTHHISSLEEWFQNWSIKAD